MAGSPITVANQISIARILLVPCVAAVIIHYFKTEDEGVRHLALALFAIAAISDGIDGYVARRFNQATELGKLLDPIGDKALVLITVVLLSLVSPPLMPPIPLWCTVMIVAREMLIILGMGTVFFLNHHAIIRPRLASKITTFLQMGLIVWTLAKGLQQVQVGLALLTAVFTFVSAVQYYADGMKQITNPPKKPDQQET